MVFRPVWKPTPEEVLDAVRSLYDDEIKPLGRLVAHRLHERAGIGDDDESARKPKVDSRVLREICEGLPEVTVERAELREFAVILKHDQRRLVNMFSPLDPYPAEFWQQVGEYFDGLDDSLARFPLGRYPCAVELMARKAPFVDNRTLGEVCHIVHLAICPRKLLGVLDVYRVPYRLSDTSATEQLGADMASPAAWQQQLLEESRRQSRVLREADWAEVREGLLIMFASSKSPTPGSVLLTTVKRLFTNELKLELNERALGYTKLSDLLKDGRLSDVCRVADDNKSVRDISQPEPKAATATLVRARRAPVGWPSRPEAAPRPAAVGPHGCWASPWPRVRAPVHPPLFGQPLSLPPPKYECMPAPPGFPLWGGYRPIPTWHHRSVDACPWMGSENQWASTYNAWQPNLYPPSQEGLEPALQYDEAEVALRELDDVDRMQGQAQGPPAAHVPPPRFSEHALMNFVVSF